MQKPIIADEYKVKDAYLRRYREGMIRLEGLACEVERWEQIAMSTAAGTGPSGGASAGGRVQGGATNAADIIMDIRKDMERLREEREEIKNMIHRHKNHRQKLLLELYYINGLSVDEVANKIRKTAKWTRESIRQAVNALNAEICENE